MSVGSSYPKHLPEPDSGEDHHVGVFEGEVVKHDERVVVLVDAIHETLIGGQLRAGKGEGGGETGCVHIAVHFELVESGGERGFEAIFDLEASGFGDDQ